MAHKPPPGVLPFRSRAERDFEAHHKTTRERHHAVLESFAVMRKEAIEAKKEGSPFSCTAIVMVGAAQVPGDYGGLRSRYSVCCAGHATYLIGALRELEAALVEFVRNEHESEDHDPEEGMTP